MRAAAESAIPLISAVGHETDWTLIDHAADARAPTPTKAAEWAVPKYADLIETTADLELRLRKCVRRTVEPGARSAQGIRPQPAAPRKSAGAAPSALRRSRAPARARALGQHARARQTAGRGLRRACRCGSSRSGSIATASVSIASSVPALDRTRPQHIDTPNPLRADGRAPHAARARAARRTSARAHRQSLGAPAPEPREPHRARPPRARCAGADAGVAELSERASSRLRAGPRSGRPRSPLGRGIWRMATVSRSNSPMVAPAPASRRSSLRPADAADPPKPRPAPRTKPGDQGSLF